MPFELPKLPYSYDSLEPHIDARTMEIHHSKHHAGYTNNLNNAIVGTEFENKSIEEICAAEGLSGATRNNGGGFYNHCLFWDILTPNPDAISNGFLSVIDRSFGSMEGMKKEFSEAASSRFGSGWAWLCVKNNQLSICSTANQDNPIMDGQCGGEPILCLDVWEHAYYLNYQNRRPDYIASFWNIVNWQAVESKYQSALK
jgi:Fe-Mn family superoxide dismutase